MAYQNVKVTIIGVKTPFSTEHQARISKSFKYRPDANNWIDSIVTNEAIVDIVLNGISCILIETTKTVNDEDTDSPSLTEVRTEYIYEW